MHEKVWAEKEKTFNSTEIQKQTIILHIFQLSITQQYLIENRVVLKAEKRLYMDHLYSLPH